MGHRTFNIHPNGRLSAVQRPTAYWQAKADAGRDLVGRLVGPFRRAMAGADAFDTPPMELPGVSRAVAGRFLTVSHTAGFCTWTSRPPGDPAGATEEASSPEAEVYTLLLSGVSREADAEVRRLFAEATEPAAAFRKKVWEESHILPVALNVYVRPDAVAETAVVAGAEAVAVAFFSLLGVGLGRGGGRRGR
ncbi:MAG TPA: hypothetical protein VF796_12435 [Humisphaera sp.]